MTRTLEELKQQESVVAPHPPQTASRSADVRHQLYLDSDEGNVGKLFDESSHLLTVFTFIKPRTPLHLHLTHRERKGFPAGVESKPRFSTEKCFCSGDQVNIQIYLEVRLTLNSSKVQKTLFWTAPV